MATHDTSALARLSNARTRLELFNSAPGESSLEERLYQKFLKVYIRDLAMTSGLENTYRDDLDRLHEIKNGIRACDPLFDSLAELVRDTGEIPAHVAVVLEHLATATLELAYSVRAIEARHPEWAETFAADRRMYADWQAGIGPLAGSPWHTDIEADQHEEL